MGGRSGLLRSGTRVSRPRSTCLTPVRHSGVVGTGGGSGSPPSVRQRTASRTSGAAPGPPRTPRTRRPGPRPGPASLAGTAVVPPPDTGVRRSPRFVFAGRGRQSCQASSRSPSRAAALRRRNRSGWVRAACTTLTPTMPAQATSSPGVRRCRRRSPTAGRRGPATRSRTRTAPPGVRGPRRPGVPGHLHPLLRQLPAHPALHRAVDALVDLLQEGVDQRGLVLLAQFPAGLESGVEFLLQVGVPRVHSGHTAHGRQRDGRRHWG